jgi:hypothetical protein
MVEQRTENPCVTGSIPVDATGQMQNLKWQNGENCFAILHFTFYHLPPNKPLLLIFSVFL